MARTAAARVGAEWQMTLRGVLFPNDAARMRRCVKGDVAGGGSEAVVDGDVLRPQDDADDDADDDKEGE